jgi:hypothetical protein
MTRTIRRTVARAMIAALLFAQMMVAAYACPVISPRGADGPMPAEAARHAVVAVPDSPRQAAEMPAGCGGMTFDSPNLCAAHCQAGDQNIDGAQTPAAPAFMLSSFYVVHIPFAPAELDRNSAPTEAINAIPPPHAILHCCFRI